MEKDGRFAEFYKTFLNEMNPKFQEIEGYREELLDKYRRSYYAFDKCNYKRQFKEYLKIKFRSKLLQTFGNISQNNSVAQYIADETCAKTDFSKVPPDGYYFDDSFEGSYNGINFQIAEFLYEDENRSDGTITTNSCIAMLFDYNKKITSTVEIVSDSVSLSLAYIIIFSTILFLFVIYSIIGKVVKDIFFLYIVPFVLFGSFRLISPLIGPNLLKKNNSVVNLEDPKFRSRFSVYSSDQVEARYHCTPAFMDRLYNLKTAFGARGLSCAFFNNSQAQPKVLIQIYSSKDLFELGDINKPIYDDSSIFAFYRELNSIHQIIDALKLDNKIGL